jgi:hypothetical protein
LAEGLLDASFPTDYQDYRREFQAALADCAQLGQVFVVPLDIDEVLTFAAGSGLDPARRSTRLRHLDGKDSSGDLRWPPERNAPCWCGSARKYKKCCGSPGFSAQPIPDRGRVILEATHDRQRRRLAVPSRIRLDTLHHALRDAFDHEGDHPYGFEIEGAEIHTPQANCDCAKPDETHLPELANEPGQSFRYRYGLAPGLEHTITIAEIVPVTPAHNTIEHLEEAEK